MTNQRPVISYPDLTAPMWRARRIWAVSLVVLMLTLMTLLG